jgi:hypothetical protein
MGVVPGAELSVTEFSEFDGNLHIKVGKSKEEVVLGPRVTNQVYTENIK